MPKIQYVGWRYDKPELLERTVWNPHLLYPALVPVYRNEEVGYGPGTSGAYRTGELPGTGWHGQSFSNNPSPADLLRLGGRVPTGGDVLLATYKGNVSM